MAVMDPTATNPYDQSANYLNQAGDIFSGIGSGGYMQNINSYLNPFYQNVTDTALGRMDTNFQQQNNQLGDAAGAAGAFGGGRHGVVEGVLGGEYNKNVGDVSGNLAMQGFNQAQGMAQQDQYTAAQGSTQLGNNMFNIGNKVADRQMQAGNMQQNLMQQILGGGQQQFQQMTNNPYQTIDMFQGINQGDSRNNAGMGTGSSTPGMFDYMSLGLQSAGGKK